MSRYRILLLAALTAAVTSCTGGDSDGSLQADASAPASADAAQPGSGISWTTERYTLTADALHIETGGKLYQALGVGPMIDIDGDSGDDTYMTIEAEFWLEMENNVSTRFNIYLRADGSNWWSDEIRHYNGEAEADNPDWVFYTGEFFKTPLGTPFAGNVDLVSDAGQQFAGSIHFENLRLSVFQ